MLFNSVSFQFVNTFTFEQDRDRGIASAMPRSSEPDYQFNDRIKSMEHKITAKNTAITEKKPKDLLRAIGKIESNDWNIREIEKKIEQSKKTEVGKSREKVPKWSKEQFLQRQNKMARPLDHQGSVDEKFKEIDATIKNFDKQMKDGAILERGQRGKNKVASIAGTFGKKEEDKQHQEDKSSLQRSVRKTTFTTVLSYLITNIYILSELEGWCSLCWSNCVRNVSFLQAKSLSDGEDFSRRPHFAPRLPQVSPLSY